MLAEETYVEVGRENLNGRKEVSVEGFRIILHTVGGCLDLPEQWTVEEFRISVEVRLMDGTALFWILCQLLPLRGNVNSSSQSLNCLSSPL